MELEINWNLCRRYQRKQSSAICSSVGTHPMTEKIQEKREFEAVTHAFDPRSTATDIWQYFNIHTVTCIKTELHRYITHVICI